ncbi:MAG: Ig-like domain-containing protein [Propionibacteriaceae bacterium]|nr:Ig-like domain-containing protein [Propionibacteriaceae bacterium]
MASGQSWTVQVVTTPATVLFDKVTWSSSDPSVAEVAVDGSKVLAVGAGQATITGTSRIRHVTHSYTVDVYVEVESVDLGPDLTLTFPETHQLTATVSPADATDPSVTYYDNDPVAFTVSDDGLITTQYVNIASLTQEVGVMTANGRTDTVAVTVLNPYTYDWDDETVDLAGTYTCWPKEFTTAPHLTGLTLTYTIAAEGTLDYDMALLTAATWDVWVYSEAGGWTVVGTMTLDANGVGVAAVTFPATDVLKVVTAPDHALGLAYTWSASFALSDLVFA